MIGFGSDAVGRVFLIAFSTCRTIRYFALSDPHGRGTLNVPPSRGWYAEAAGAQTTLMVSRAMRTARSFLSIDFIPRLVYRLAHPRQRRENRNPPAPQGRRILHFRGSLLSHLWVRSAGNGVTVTSEW